MKLTFDFVFLQDPKDFADQGQPEYAQELQDIQNHYKDSMIALAAGFVNGVDNTTIDHIDMEIDGEHYGRIEPVETDENPS